MAIQLRATTLMLTNISAHRLSNDSGTEGGEAGELCPRSPRARVLKASPHECLGCVPHKHAHIKLQPPCLLQAGYVLASHTQLLRGVSRGALGPQGDVMDLTAY